jgi:hypothetical protein
VQVALRPVLVLGRSGQARSRAAEAHRTPRIARWAGELSSRFDAVQRLRNRALRTQTEPGFGAGMDATYAAGGGRRRVNSSPMCALDRLEPPERASGAFAREARHGAVRPIRHPDLPRPDHRLHFDRRRRRSNA